MKRSVIRELVQIYFPRLAIFYRTIRDRRYLKIEPIITRMGYKFVGNAAMQNGYFEIEETKLVQKILPHVDIVLNVGANVGYYCCMALSSGKHVIAFEPMPDNLHCLLKNIKSNNWDNMAEVFPLALSNKVGIVEIFGGGTGASLIKGWSGIPEQHIALVPCSTLDTVIGSRLDGKKCFVLVDIEGAEKFFLEGSKSFLVMEPKPIWIVEISITEHQPKGVAINPNLLSTFELFWDKGYESWTANDEFREVCRDEILSAIDSGIDTLKTHNFIFIEKGMATQLGQAAPI
jgi:FkbM family methyltransferase